MLPSLFDDERRGLLQLAAMMCATSLAILPVIAQSSHSAVASTLRG